jgi:hypothetical protein
VKHLFVIILMICGMTQPATAPAQAGGAVAAWDKDEVRRVRATVEASVKGWSIYQSLGKPIFTETVHIAPDGSAQSLYTPVNMSEIGRTYAYILLKLANVEPTEQAIQEVYRFLDDKVPDNSDKIVNGFVDPKKIIASQICDARQTGDSKTNS